MRKHLKRWLFGKGAEEVLVRILVLCIMAVLCHFLFLAAGQQTLKKEIFSWMRLVCFLGILWQCFYLGEGSPLEKWKDILFRTMMFVGSTISRVFDFFFHMTQNTVRGGGTVEIKGYEEQVNSIALGLIGKWRKPKYKKWKNMDNQERIRYLYYKSVKKHSKRDVEFTYQKTAWEIYDELEEKNKLEKGDEELFRMYNGIRYREKVQVSAHDVEKCKGSGRHFQ